MDDRKLASTLQQAKQYLAEGLVADGATVHPRSSSTSYLFHVAQTRDTLGSRRALARYDAVAGAAIYKYVTKHGTSGLPHGALQRLFATEDGVMERLKRPSRRQRFRSMIAAFWSRLRGR
ncbi:hypothetical protein [Xanthomonas phage NEB7]|nr:hypothetical protein [Xanthomonas phage NEB7]